MQREPEAEPYQVECYACSGSGSWRDSGGYEVAPGYFLAGWIVAILAYHGATVRRWRDDHEDPPPVWFIAGEVEGLAMPMRPPGGAVL